MSISLEFKDLQTGEVAYQRDLLPSQELFWDAQERFVLFSGGLGCVGGETLVDTIDGPKEIRSLFEPTLVRSENGWSFALAPVRYEPAQLYRVTTDDGSSIRVTKDHRFLTPSGWKRFSRLSVGEQLVSSSSLPHSSEVSSRSIRVVGALHWTQKVLSFLSGYRREPRSYDVLPRSSQETDQGALPSLDGAHERNRLMQTGGLRGVRECIRACLYDDLRPTKGCVHLGAVLGGAEEVRISSSTSERASSLDRQPQRFQRTSFLDAVRAMPGTWLRVLGRASFPSYPNPTKIVNIEQDEVEEYYDIHVIGDHSYTANGFVNHNCGKSMILILKSIYECMSQPNNYFLLGRTSYQEIHDVLLKEFFEICHPSWIKSYTKSPHPSVVLNTFTGGSSEIIFRNLDKDSRAEILGLNLGGFGIDQAEDIPEEVFLTLKGRLRRQGIVHKGYMTSNPKLSWLLRVFKQHPEEGHRLIEASTLENKKNLPEEYVKDLLNYPESWRRQYVEGIWDESLLADNIVFAREFIERFSSMAREPIETREGLRIFKKYEKGHRYQMGIDCAEGSDLSEESLRKSLKDSAVIKIWDHTNDEEVAHWSARVAPRVTAEKAVLFAEWYGKPEIVPEMNSMGMALIDKLDDLGYSNVYRRKEFDRTSKKTLKKVGWRTTASTKQLLISHFEELCRKRKPRVYSKTTIEEFKTFVYSDVASKKGAGAIQGFHDDEVMATLLASFSEGEVSASSRSSGDSARGIIGVATVPTVTVRNGMAVPPSIPGVERRVARFETL